MVWLAVLRIRIRGIRIFPWIRNRIKKGLDPESRSVSNDTNPDPTKTIENIK